jgi:Domain of unknown function (DUF4388)
VNERQQVNPRTTLQGSLAEASLANILQMFAMNRATGCLHLSEPSGLLGEIFVEDGEISHVAVGHWQDLDALSVLLEWDQGSFTMHKDVRSPERTLNMPVQHLLLEATRLMDTRKLTGVTMPILDANAVLRASTPNLSVAATVSLNLAALPLLLKLNGERRLEQIASEIEISLLEALYLAEGLIHAGLAETVTAPKPLPEPIVSFEFIAELQRAVIRATGPIGEIVLEDSLEELSCTLERLPHAKVGLLIERINAQIRDPKQREHFEQLANQLRQAHRV